MEKYYTTTNPEETRAAAREIAATLQGGDVVCLSGELGAGKTTLAQGILQSLGAERPYISPTFVIMKEYTLKTPTPTGIKRIYHADAYRVEEKDFETLGFAEWASDPAGLTLLEWPERMANLLPGKRWDIFLETKNESERLIRIEQTY